MNMALAVAAMRQSWKLRLPLGWPRALRVSLVVAAAALLLVLPGPGLLVIGAGLGLVATEFPSVRRQLMRAVRFAETVRAFWAHRRNRAPAP
jgi:uncharacterized membrane protein YgaE (UPF0421/DUF939 family)